MPLFTGSQSDEYQTDVPHLLAVARWCKRHPDGWIITGIREEPRWSANRFFNWFRECLHTKIDRGDTRTWRKLRPTYQADLRRDAVLITDYIHRHIRYSGCRNLLMTPEMRRRYPHINNQPRED